MREERIIDFIFQTPNERDPRYFLKIQLTKQSFEGLSWLELHSGLDTKRMLEDHIEKLVNKYDVRSEIKYERQIRNRILKGDSQHHLRNFDGLRGER